jgi:hypothetical protein
MVLRYAVPALGLIVAAVLGIVVLRQERRGAESVARLEDRQQSPSASTPETKPQPYVSRDGVSPDTDPATGTTATKPSQGVVGPVAKEAPVSANQPAEAAGTAAARPPAAPKLAVADEEAERDAAKQKKEQPATETATVSDATKDRAAEPTKNIASVDSVTVKPGSVAKRDIDVRPAKSGEAAAPASGAGTGAVQTFRRAPKEAGARSRQEAKEGDYSSGETRSVEGRRFRKSTGGVWIDTAYDPSKRITDVSRGSEHYRGLVADEPAIRRIAEELDGPIIVVWKGQTYRIR